MEILQVQGISIDCILPKFINNTIYKNAPILHIVQIALTVASIENDKIPLTVISTFQNIPNKLGYYYTPAQLRNDWDVGMFLIGEEEFKRAQYGVVRLKLDFTISARLFLTTAIHEYTHASQYKEESEVMRSIGEDQMVVDAKEEAAYILAEKLTGTACEESWVIKVIDNLNKELGRF